MTHTFHADQQEEEAEEEEIKGDSTKSPCDKKNPDAPGRSPSPCEMMSKERKFKTDREFWPSLALHR